LKTSSPVKCGLTAGMQQFAYNLPIGGYCAIIGVAFCGLSDATSLR
jgi:hypothetical protein